MTGPVAGTRPTSLVSIRQKKSRSAMLITA
jgi:hypothetical protein